MPIANSLGFCPKSNDLARFQLSTFEKDELEQLATEHSLDEIHEFQLCSDAMQELANEGKVVLGQERIIDYVDMLLIPNKESIKNKSKFSLNKFVLVDECQDLNLCQIELSKKLAGENGRLLYVGDPNQAIFGFAGARCDSYQIVKAASNCVELPLSVCYRCPVSHIKLVKEIFPDMPIKAFEKAIEGKIEQVSDSVAIHQENDLILCRKTAPLISYCLQLISQGIPAKVRGRDIGNGLIGEIDAIHDYASVMGKKLSNLDKFIYWMKQYQEHKERQWQELDYRDKLSEMLGDRLCAIEAIVNSLIEDYSEKGLKDKVKSLFTDSDTFVILSTVHRAKGLEAERVFILEPDEMPLVWRHQKQWEYKQELNLLYVALTRSKSELYLMDKAAWYREGRVIEDSSTNYITN